MHYEGKEVRSVLVGMSVGRSTKIWNSHMILLGGHRLASQIRKESQGKRNIYHLQRSRCSTAKHGSNLYIRCDNMMEAKTYCFRCSSSSSSTPFSLNCFVPPGRGSDSVTSCRTQMTSFTLIHASASDPSDATCLIHQDRDITTVQRPAVPPFTSDPQVSSSSICLLRESPLSTSLHHSGWISRHHHIHWIPNSDTLNSGTMSLRCRLIHAETSSGLSFVGNF